MRMNIQIEGRQADMAIVDQQRTKRCLRVLKDVGFDIKLSFSEDSPEYTMIEPCQRANRFLPLKNLLEIAVEAEVIE